MQQRNVPIWQAEDEPDDEEIVMYSDDEMSEEQIAERERKRKAKRQAAKMVRKLQKNHRSFCYCRWRRRGSRT